MKKELVSLFFLFLFASPLFAQQQQNNGFEISAHLDGLKEGQEIYLTIMEYGSFGYGAHISTNVKNGSFHFSGVVPEGPRLYLIGFNTGENSDVGRNIRLLIDNNEKITISCDSDVNKINHGFIEKFLKIDGSPTNRTWLLSSSGFEIYKQNMGLMRINLDKIRDSIGFDPGLIGSVLQDKYWINGALYTTFFRNQYDDVFCESAIPFLLIGNKVNQWSDHASWMMDVYGKLSKRTKENYYGKSLREYARLSVGQPFPIFNLPGIDDRSLDLKSIISKSKLTLVHFWSATSIDRKKYQDELRVLYKKYHDRGFNIVGLYSGKYADEWKDIVGKEQFPWYNVADLKGEYCDNIYHEPEEPNNTTNVLIDSQGKIVAWEAREGVLQWYLVQAFGK